jgi:hypothetical protein
VRTSDLAAVQRRRELPTRVIQAFQSLVQNQVLERALGSREQPRRTPLSWLGIRLVPLIMRVPLRLIGIGLWRVHVQYTSEVGRASAARS